MLGVLDGLDLPFSASDAAAIELHSPIYADEFIIAFDMAFHGRTMGALSMGGNPRYRVGFGELLAAVDHVPYGDLKAVRAKMGPDVAAVMAGLRLSPALVYNREELGRLRDALEAQALITGRITDLGTGLDIARVGDPVRVAVRAEGRSRLVQDRDMKPAP